MTGGLAGLIERTSLRLAADYLLAAALTGLLVLLLWWPVGHLDPVADAGVRRAVYGSTLAAGLALAWGVYGWMQANYTDGSPRMVRVRAKQGKAVRAVRGRLIAQSLILSAISLACMLIDMDGSWRRFVFYVWVGALVAVALGAWRTLRLAFRLWEIREEDDKVAIGPPVPEEFTWRRSA